MQVMNTILHPSQSFSQVWLVDSRATNHMTSNLHNLSLTAPYPANDTMQTTNGEGLLVSHVGIM